jgi:hypothetical protein
MTQLAGASGVVGRKEQARRLCKCCRPASIDSAASITDELPLWTGR